MNGRLFCIAVLIVLLSSLSCVLNGQITVDFRANVTEGCSSVQADFQDNSSSTNGKIVTWEWDLGGVSADIAAPGRIFANIGSYTICLTITDEQGNSETLCKDDYINVYDLPQVDFEVDISSGCAPLVAVYKDLSTSANGSISKWTWGLNGSNGIIETSDIERPIFSEYKVADSYSISLSVTDNKGCSNTVAKNNLIEVLAIPEIRIATSEPIGCAFPMTVDFENLSPQENIAYSWDFGNGKSYEGLNPDPLIYASEGAYNIKITATNILTGCSDSLLLQDYINSGGTIDFNFSPKRSPARISGIECPTISETGSSSDSIASTIGKSCIMLPFADRRQNQNPASFRNSFFTTFRIVRLRPSKIFSASFTRSMYSSKFTRPMHGAEQFRIISA